MSSSKSLPHFSSVEFIESLKSHRHEAFESLVKHYTKQLINASYGLGFSDNDAQELVQSVWITCYDKIASFEGRSHIRTYLFGILYNKAKELKRERIKHTSDEEFEKYFNDKFDERGHWINHPVSPEQFLESAQTLEIIEACLEKLPIQQKMAFFLKEVEGALSEEICKILEVTITNLGVLIYRAKNKLRLCIERKTK